MYPDGMANNFYYFSNYQATANNGAQGLVYFDPITGQYFYQKKPYYFNGQMPANAQAAFYQNAFQQFNANMNNQKNNSAGNSETNDQSEKVSSGVIITEVTDEEDEFEINRKKYNNQKDYVDAISLNDE
jgi:hypothetical protein